MGSWRRPRGLSSRGQDPCRTHVRWQTRGESANGTHPRQAVSTPSTRVPVGSTRQDGAVDLADVAALDSGAGRALTGAATARLDDGEDLLAVAERLRAGNDPALVSLALTQARLRRRARAKFGPDADLLLWTEAGLEQATRRSVALHRAERLGLAGVRQLADLCCGVGGDLLALAAAAARVRAVDCRPRDRRGRSRQRRSPGPVRPRRRARAATSGPPTWPAATPRSSTRRAGRPPAGARSTRTPTRPRTPSSLELAARLPATAAKVAPGIPHALVPAGRRGGVGVRPRRREGGGAVVRAARRPAWPRDRRATLLPSGATVADDPALGPPPVGPAGRWLHEPDGAVVRAGLVAEVAASLGRASARPVDRLRHHGRPTSGRRSPTASPWTRSCRSS